MSEERKEEEGRPQEATFAFRQHPGNEITLEYWLLKPNQEWLDAVRNDGASYGDAPVPEQIREKVHNAQFVQESEESREDFETRIKAFVKEINQEIRQELER